MCNLEPFHCCWRMSQQVMGPADVAWVVVAAVVGAWVGNAFSCACPSSLHHLRYH